MNQMTNIQIKEKTITKTKEKEKEVHRNKIMATDMIEAKQMTIEAGNN